MSQAKPVTIYEVSKLAKVSIATVSRALNPDTRHRVAPATFRRIAAVIDQCGYTPSLAARHLGGSTLKTIGVVLPQFRGVFCSDYYMKVLAGIADALLETDYQFKLIMLKMGQYQWDRYDFKAGEGVRGLIVTHWPKFFSHASVLERLRLPCVVISDPEKGVQAHFVSGDNLQGGELAARHLYARGHRQIAVLTGPAWSSDSRLRVQGFQQFFRRTGSRHKLTLLQGDFHEELAQSAAEAFLKTRPAVTAFFCCNDLTAFGVLKQLRAMRLSCPKDVSLIGYDDIPRAEAAEPPLTTVRVPVYEVAAAGARRLVERLAAGDGGTAFVGQTLLPVSLVERQSVARR